MSGRLRYYLILITIANVSADDSAFFESKVRPVLARTCFSCHGATKQFSNLRLDSRESVLRGGDRGPAAVSGKAAESKLIQAIRQEGSLRMPPGGRLKPDEIAALEQWVSQGLFWPAGAASTALDIKHEHWAYQPVKLPAIPAAGGEPNPVDRFIGARLSRAKVNKAQPADRQTLARRAWFVLLGLPPSPEEMQAFVNDRAPRAYERLVDKLLASPHFGERWARHWMDVVRFAETYGYEWNYEIHGAWRYRDYLIRAFNDDVPYDQFVREHIAGDLLSSPRISKEGGFNESILATAFYRLGEMGHDNCNQFPEIRTDVVDNQIDTLSKAFQAATVSCARCHDHKIDPIPTEDYYALYGILNSARPVTRTVDLRGPSESERGLITSLKNQIRKALAAAWLRESAGLGRHLAAAVEWERDSASAASSAVGLEFARVGQWQRLLQRRGLDLSDPLYPVAEWMKGTADWVGLAAQYANESGARRKFNQETFTTFGDFRSGTPAGWNFDGWGYRTGHAAGADFAVATEGGEAVTGVYPAGVYTHLFSDRLNGVLRSPILPKDKKYITLEVAGGKFGALRLVMDGCVIGEDHQLLKSPAPRWLRVASKSDQPLPTYLELTTKGDNPRLPERPEKFKDLKEEQLSSPRSYWGVTRVLLHNAEVEPKADLGHLARLFQGDSVPGAAGEVAARFERAVQDAIRAWSEGTASPEDITWINWLLETRVLTNSRNLSAELRALTEEYRNAERTLTEPAVVYSMADVDAGHDFPILLGGQAKSPGRPAPRHFLSLLPERLRAVGTGRSGRLEMADAIASKDNPLTARVMVNRIWHHVFGRGLVVTPDDFGRYGQQPAHPELLDYLAWRFANDGWSVKRVIRLLLLSEAFQRESGGNANDDLWSYYPVRRIEAEAVRDSILAVSGSLDHRQFGPSIQPHRREAQPYRRLFQGPLNGEGRRSIYLKITRMEGPRFLETFDFPAPLQTRGKRDVTNVPSQALALLNDPFVTRQALEWARRMIAEGKDDSADARVARMFERALARPPMVKERLRFRSLVEALRAQHAVAEETVLSSEAVWKDVAQTFFSLKEFLYLR